jgi:aconitate decarboxylase
MDAIHRFSEHVAATRFEDIPEEAVSAAETMILDTIGVGLAGSSGPLARELADTQEAFGKGDDAHVWSIGKRLPAAAAAFCNAYQIHNSEFDAIHEAAVAHVMSAVVPAALACAERQGGVEGRRFVEAVVLGVDVASNLGVAARTGLRFFRPATVGAFGATAAVGKLMGFDADRMTHAFSICYGQLCGTMQAHEEGSMLLAMQLAFNARNAVVAAELAAAGVTGPLHILEGRFGYFNLFESDGAPAEAAETLGKVWRISEVAHKPFPSGRATHGVVDGCLELKARHRIDIAAIEHIECVVPPLIHQLVGRPPKADMDVNYARLCAAYVAARALIRGTVDLSDFNDAAYADPASQALARKFSIRVRDDDSPNALTPVDVTMTLADGSSVSAHLEHVYGSPFKPMTREAQLAKFRANAAGAIRPLPEGQAEKLITKLADLSSVDDVAKLVPLLVG